MLQLEIQFSPKTKIIRKCNFHFLFSVTRRSRGILVKLVIYVSRGHWKAKIPNYWKSYCFGYHVPVYTAYDEKKTTGHLIAPFTSLVCLIHRFPMSPRDKYFLYHVFTWQIACILHKSFVTGAIKIQFICETIQRHCCLHIMSQE